MDFACKNFKIEEIIRCSLNLTKGEYKILDFLIKTDKPKLSSQEISESLGLDLSTVQRCLKKLYEKEIINRSQINLSSGGYQFNYGINDKTKIKEMVISIIQKWTDKFEEEIRNWK